MFSPKLQKSAFIAFIALIAASLLAYQIFGRDIGAETFRGFIGSFGLWAPLAFIALFVLSTIFIPSTPFMAAAGVLFGFWYGLIYTLIGCFLSSAIVFYISRRFGETEVENLIRNKHLDFLAQYDRRLESGGVWDLIVLRIIPIMPFNVLNILMGVSKIKTRHYLIGTMVGLIPSVLATVYFGTFIFGLF